MVVYLGYIPSFPSLGAGTGADYACAWDSAAPKTVKQGQLLADPVTQVLLWQGRKPQPLSRTSKSLVKCSHQRQTWSHTPDKSEFPSRWGKYDKHLHTPKYNPCSAQPSWQCRAALLESCCEPLDVQLRLPGEFHSAQTKALSKTVCLAHIRMSRTWWDHVNMRLENLILGQLWWSNLKYLKGEIKCSGCLQVISRKVKRQHTLEEKK